MFKGRFTKPFEAALPENPNPVEHLVRPQHFGDFYGYAAKQQVKPGEHIVAIGVGVALAAVGTLKVIDLLKGDK